MIAQIFKYMHFYFTRLINFKGMSVNSFKIYPFFDRKAPAIPFELKTKVFSMKILISAGI